MSLYLGDIDLTFGMKGLDGKSAYEYALEGGYTGTEQDFYNKLVKEIPTKVSELQNDSNFITKAVNDLELYYLKSETYTREEINERVSLIPKFKIDVVKELPTTDISYTTIYIVKNDPDNEDDNLFTEYIRIDMNDDIDAKDDYWEKLGEQKLDLSSFPGKKVTGQIFTVNGTQIVAADGAEIFNDYENNIATGSYSHAEGTKTIATGYSSHAEGGIYGASNSKPEGWTNTLTASDYPTFLTEDVTIYGSIANGNNSHAEGGGTYAHGEGSHAEGNFTLAMNYGSHSEGYGTQATGYVSHAEGYQTQAKGWAAHVEGAYAKAIGDYSHAEGQYSEASGSHSHAEGNNTKASGYQSHTEGSNTKATGSCAHAEGYYTEAASYSHSEGGYTKATGNYSHAEGYETQAQGIAAHAEGWESIASGNYSHAGGYYAEASGDYSHAEGYYTIANGNYQHVQGKYNIEDTENRFAHIVGNGEYQAFSNAHTLDWDGNAWFAGDIKIGGTKYDEGFSIPYAVNPIIIPAGRMYGDLDGDGVITQDDADIFVEYFGLFENEYNGNPPIEFSLSDFNKDGMVDTNDFHLFIELLNGNKYGASGNDYTGNYIANPNYSTKTAQFYTDINLSSLKSSQDVIVAIASSNVDASIFVKGEIMEGVLRIWVKRPPISDIECLVTVINNGSGKCSISGGDVGTYIDSIKSIVDTDIVKLKKLNRKKYNIPAGRMYGDLNGDGIISEEEITIFTDVFANEANYTGTDILELADVDRSGGIGRGDSTVLRSIIDTKQYGASGNDYTGNWKANPNYSTETAQFYTDITVSDITSTCNVSVEIATPNIDSSIFVKAEPINGAVRIWVTRPPISAVDCLISFNEGDGVGVISGGDTNVYVDNMSYEKTKNKVIEINEESTNEQYPSAKAVYTSLLTNKPYMTKITLTSNGWDTTTLTQSATIIGILEDETAQAIYINPVFNNTMNEEISSCNVYASAQGNNSITFSCDSIPTIDIDFYVKWRDVAWIEDPTSTNINSSVMSVKGVEF